MSDEAQEKWNHNSHFHPVVLRAIPDGAKRGLDVGCGIGLLTRQMRERIPLVTGIDVDQPSLDDAKALGGDITYLQGDALTYPFAEHSFDFIASVATVHHFDFETGLRRFAQLLAPGGVLAIIGFGRSNLTSDLPLDAWGFARANVERLWRKQWTHPSPTVWPPPMTRTECRKIALQVLPNAEFRRRMWLRYSLIWQAPA